MTTSNPSATPCTTVTSVPSATPCATETSVTGTISTAETELAVSDVRKEEWTKDEDRIMLAWIKAEHKVKTLNRTAAEIQDRKLFIIEYVENSYNLQLDSIK